MTGLNIPLTAEPVKKGEHLIPVPPTAPHPTTNPMRKGKPLPSVIIALYFNKKDGSYRRLPHPDLRQIYFDIDEGVILCNFGKKNEIRQGIVRLALREYRKKKGNLLFEVKVDGQPEDS